MSENHQIQISVIIPAYNEEKVIQSTLQDVRAYLKKHFESFEILIVDDGSTDATVDIARSVNGVTVIKNDRNKGKGFSVRNGMLASKGELMLFMDADNSTNIRELDHFLPDMRDSDIVIGSRALQASDVQISQNILKKTVGKFGNLFIRVILGLNIQDTQCGFKLFKASARKLFEKQTLHRWGFDFEILFLARINKLKIKESPVTWINNFDSKVKPSDYIKSFIEVVKVKWRHLTGKYN